MENRLRHTNFGYPHFSAALGIREKCSRDARVVFDFRSTISDRFSRRLSSYTRWKRFLEEIVQHLLCARIYRNLLVRLLEFSYFNELSLSPSLCFSFHSVPFFPSKGMRNYGRYREYGARKGRERERERGKVGPRDTFVDHLYDPWFRRSWKRRVQADLTELYLVQPLRDMTDRCISALISVLSSWPLVRTSGCFSSFFFPSTSLFRVFSLLFSWPSPRFHFRRLSREEGVRGEGGRVANEGTVTPLQPTTT